MHITQTYRKGRTGEENAHGAIIAFEEQNNHQREKNSWKEEVKGNEKSSSSRGISHKIATANKMQENIYNSSR